MTIKSHQMAIDVEMKIRHVFDCERYGFGGIANSDFIDYGGCYTAFASALSTFFSGEYAGQIDLFLERYLDLNGKRIEDDEERFEQAINEFKDLLKQIKE